jgi:aryl-alcohol dehydrogenase-like predicted oxidoreductase
MVVRNATQEHTDRAVARAVEAGINYFDVAPTYGHAQDVLGPALEPYRQDCFLACKTTQRQADGAREEMEGSIAALRTEYLDLYQLHAIRTDEDIETAFGPGGAMEVLQAARDEGRVRFLGFTAHSVEAAMAAMDRFDFDTIMFPVNFVTWWQGDFGAQVVARARRQEMGIFAIKSMCWGPWPEGMDRSERSHPSCWYRPVADREQARLALSFTFSQGVTASLPPADEGLFWLAVDLLPEVGPLSVADEARLRELAAEEAPLFRYEA